VLPILPHVGNTDTTLTGNAVVFAIYIDSYLFVFATAILQLALGVNTSLAFCSGAIFLCLACYVTTKVVRLTTRTQQIFELA
jgi:hypothetical protein